MALYNKLIVIAASFLIITLAFLSVSSERGTTVGMTSTVISTFGQTDFNGSWCNVSFIDSYGSGGQLSIYSEYGSPSRPVSYASVFQDISIERGTFSGEKWTPLCTHSINMTNREFYAINLNLSPGYYEIKFGTLLDYNNLTDFYNGTVPALHSAFMLITLPYPALLMDMILVELPSLAALMILYYVEVRKGRNLI